MTPLEVTPATPEQAPILAHLLELYIYDFSEFLNLQIGDDGRFTYPPLPLYWSDPDRHPFLVRIDGNLAGFVLVKRAPGASGHPLVWDMAEFFILRSHRKHGIGTHVAHEIWRRFPGSWEVRVMPANIPALHFWAAAISRFVGHPVQPASIEKDGQRRTVFSFESPRGDQLT